MNKANCVESLEPGLKESITGIDRGTQSAFYPVGKLDAHLQDIKHLAISIFVFRNEYLLLQKRADGKYHSGGLWANSVCSHPRWNENPQDCADRRLYEELGWNTELAEFGTIDYSARVGDLYENEHVHCFYGHIDDDHRMGEFNEREVQAIEWLTIPQILGEIARRPETFTEWFKIYMAQHREMIGRVMHPALKITL